MANLDPHVVGRRLRDLRTRRDLTLADVAAETDISVSTLSRLESGSRRATLELLVPLARTYRVTLDELVDAPPTGDPRVHAKPIEAWGATIIPLTTRQGGQRAFKHVLRPDARSVPEPRSHEGYDWVYVLDGRLRLVLGEHDIVMGPRRGRRVRHPDPALVRVRRRPPGRAALDHRAAGGADARARPPQEGRHDRLRARAVSARCRRARHP